MNAADSSDCCSSSSSSSTIAAGDVKLRDVSDSTPALPRLPTQAGKITTPESSQTESEDVSPQVNKRFFQSYVYLLLDRWYSLFAFLYNFVYNFIMIIIHSMIISSIILFILNYIYN